MKRTIELGDLVEHNWRENAAVAPAISLRSVAHELAVCITPGSSCRLLVKATRLAERWPIDPEFRRFAAKVADAVQSFIGIGGQLKPGDPECICPLGCLPGAYGPRPGSVTGYDKDACESFYEGYDALPAGARATKDAQNPYFRLGAAYRARFAPKAKEAA